MYKTIKCLYVKYNIQNYNTCNIRYCKYIYCISITNVGYNYYLHVFMHVCMTYVAHTLYLIFNM